jgi:protein-disulfide isomerase
MKSTLTVVLAVVAAIGVAAAGYLLGTRQPPPPDGAAIEAMIADMIEAREPPPPASPVPMEMADAGDTLSQVQQSEVEAIVRNYLIANPEIVRDAIYELQRKEDAAAKAAQVSTITDNSARLFSSAKDVVLGNPAGDVTLVEFFDYNCGYCRRAHADMVRLLDEDPNLRIVLKEFPILGPGSVEASQIAAAVLLTAPDKYRAFHDALLTEPGQVDGARALAVAEDLGLDPAALNTESDSEAVQALITESHELASLLQLTGTPSYVTPQEVVVGAVGYDALKASIEKARGCLADSANC